MRTGKYLNENERYVIEIELASKTSISEIARRLGRARSTIQREIKHGRVKQQNDFGYTHVYKADYAQRMARQRQAKKVPVSKLLTIT
ncbi:helix-turn-helix domain-containing protein [Collinsella sp. AGMB00827]|uniref:Helix-turn-helix domain-containing protein n=1 Tax=Collinsella ureilytica TaxID=2869515 RepID=A0ABS7MMI2_9ACTN|nr:helix-turn-helix domain-containing protein [Collinsella urealyticum]MBY4798280.1 helix-turn-helix domain-containing protein [Collinsella urealyticum]